MSDSPLSCVRDRTLLLALLLLAAAPESRAAQAPEDSPAGQSESVSDPAAVADARELNRILHLRGGSVLRARARKVADHWEFRSDGAWRALPAESVERASVERDVLEEARRLERELGEDHSARRVGLADWMLREGLLAEGLQQLDRVLEADPDQAQALELLAHLPVAFSPFVKTGGGKAAGDEAAGDPDALMRHAASLTPSMRELAVLELARIEPREELLERFRRELVSHSVRLRALAALGLRRQFPGEELRGLVARAVLDGSADVRASASLALRAANEPAVVAPAVRALGSSNASVRENAAEALGSMGYPAAVEPLVTRLASLASPQAGGWKAPGSHIFVGRQVAYISDFDVEVAQFAAIADPTVSVLTEGSVLDVRMVGVTVQSIASESRKIRRSLAQITGEAPGESAKSWLEWWEKNRSRWSGENGAAAKPEGPSTRN